MSNPISREGSTVGSLEANVTSPLFQVKLLNALRSGDPALIHPFLAEIGKERRNSHPGAIDVGSAALHLAIRCASAETVTLLLSHRAISPNGVYPLGSGTTPLHLAASLGRVDVVNLLLEQDEIDDSLRDVNGKTCRDVAKGKDVMNAIDDSRSFFNASYRSQLHTYIHSPPGTPLTPEFLALLGSSRVRLIDFSYLDEDTGLSLLHEAAKRKDLRLIELAIRAGADVFIRDRKGKTAYDRAGKDDRVKVFLKQFANQDTTLIDEPLSEPQVLKGYLNKYTNVARGYNTRWFVLKDGVLSYYRHQDDETVASRGSISMRTAILKHTSGGDKLRFEVDSTPSRANHSGAQKWYLKANHPVEARRWTQAIRRSIDWYKRDPESRRSWDSEVRSAHVHDGKNVASGPLKPFLSALEGDSSSSYTGHRDDEDSEYGHGLNLAVPSASAHISGVKDEAESDRNDDSSAVESLRRTVPHEANFELHGNATTAQMELISQMLSDLILPPEASSSMHDLRAGLKESFDLVENMMAEYVRMTKDRDAWWKHQLETELNRQKVWEESLQIVVKEGETLENELRQRSRRRGSVFRDSRIDGGAGGTLRVKALPMPPSTSVGRISDGGRSLPLVSVASGASTASPPVTASLPKDISAPAGQQVIPTTTALPVFGDDTDMDEEDEFFDAIEFNTLPNLVVPEPLASSGIIDPSATLHFDKRPYTGYKHFRDRLSVDNDNRPSTSLWSVLKHSIGKDLTKITFPVFFNEPTSMLQRMAEDMEFSECLDVAVGESDPQKRIAFVAAFAMSNYSSTIGRIAKPFNPMLSETFEYVRLDKEYRYISEQVSHHPPVSACWAESSSWNYFGEVFARNKFMGKSFEIEPTGVAHAELLIPKEWGPNYPKAKGKWGGSKVVEHYSWKKVTTNISGFILGSPTIDHYGDMIITNHRTGDQCVLTFKPRGWRGKDAFEISGYVRDASGNITYEIAGRWNSQLIARVVGTGVGFLHPDAEVAGPNSSSATPEYILLWRNSEKLPAPFNLTPFAMSLNDCPRDTLRPYLCPTDCRLRPDQRAFEIGKYELANDLKNHQEEQQRTTRKAREEGRLPIHKPRWFFAETDGDTGERVWTPVRVGDKLEYWIERERVWRENVGQWKNVDTIFIEEPASLHDS